MVALGKRELSMLVRNTPGVMLSLTNESFIQHFLDLGLFSV